MKRFFFFAFAISLLACSSKKDTNGDTKETNNNSLVDNIENLSKLEKVTDEYTKRAEELKKLTPVSSDGLKTIFKESVLGIKRTDFSVQNVVGYSTGEASYKINDSASYKITINDCAGEAGSGMMIMMYTTQLNIESESETQLEKTIDFMGTRAHKVFDKVNNNYRVSFLQNDRYFVMAEGNKVSFEDLEAFLKDIDLTRLKEIK